MGRSLILELLNNATPAYTWIPPRVYLGRSAYEFHPNDCSCSQAQVWAAWELLINERPDDSLFAGLVDSFFKSDDFFELAAETQKDYRKYSKKIIDVLGMMPPDNIRPEQVRKHLDKLGVKSRTQANREKAFMSRFFQWAFERGYAKGNPTKGVKQFKEQGRDRYITNEEYSALYSVSPAIALRSLWR